MNKCCEVKANREVIKEDLSTQVNGGVEFKVSARKEKCTSCGGIHYVMDAEPLILKMKENG